MAAAKVMNISVEDVGPNPHNPRRLFDEEPMQILLESIAKLGILVPITVYTAPRGHRPANEKYILLDGERRWRCVKELKKKRKARKAAIPAIVVAKPDDTQNMLTMFHIHNVREGWQLMPTALKLETLMKELKETNERKLSELTKLRISQIRRCKILLTYPMKFQKMMLAPPTERMKADFFIELDRIRRPAMDHKFGPWIRKGDSKCIDVLLDKYENKTIVAVTDFRKLAEIYKASTNKRQKKRLRKEFLGFLNTPTMRIDDIHVPGATFAKEAKELKRTTRRLLSQIKAVDLDSISSDKELVRTLRELSKLIHDKLERALLIGAKDDQGDKNPD